MKIITGPINCALCGWQIFNSRMVEAVPDGDEPQHICKKCFDDFGSKNHVLVKTEEVNH